MSQGAARPLSVLPGLAPLKLATKEASQGEHALLCLGGN